MGTGCAIHVGHIIHAHSRTLTTQPHYKESHARTPTDPKNLPNDFRPLRHLLQVEQAG